MIRPSIKFEQGLIGRIQRREKTQTRRPLRRSKLSDGRRVIRPCAYREGQHYQIVATEDRPFEWSDLSADDRRRYARLGADAGSTIYKRIDTPLETDFIRVTCAPRQEALIDISEADLAAEGFEEREEFIEYITAFCGEHVETVWVVEFEYTSDAPNLLALQAGQVHPEQYVHSAAGALPDEPEAVDPQTLASYATHNRTKDTLRRLERHADTMEDSERALDAYIESLRQLARQHGIDTRSQQRLAKRKLDEVKAKLRKAA